MLNWLIDELKQLPFVQCSVFSRQPFNICAWHENFRTLTPIHQTKSTRVIESMTFVHIAFSKWLNSVCFVWYNWGTYKGGQFNCCLPTIITILLLLMCPRWMFVATHLFIDILLLYNGCNKLFSTSQIPMPIQIIKPVTRESVLGTGYRVGMRVLDSNWVWKADTF